MESAAEEDLALPPEVWHRIMRFLAPADLYHIKCVCSDWAKYIQSDGPWNTYLERYFGKRYAKARFVSDPTFSAMERFWRTTRLHDNWVKGVQQQSVLGGSFGSVRQLKLDGETLAINTGTQLQVYDFEKQQTVWHLPDDMPAHYHIPTFDIKNKVIVMPGTRDQAHLIFIDTLTGKRKQCISTGQHIYVARLAPGTSTLCATGGRKIQVWDTLHSSNAILTLGEQHRGVVNCLELDVNTVTACHKGKKIRMWDVRSKERILTLSGHNHLIHCIAINGHNIASGSKDHTLRLWDRRKPDTSTELTGHHHPVRAIAMDDWKIVSGGRDSIVQVWDVSSRKKLYKLHEMETTHCLAFNEYQLYVGGSTLVRHDFTPKLRSTPFDCALS